jgi:hypothetical protein
VLVAGGLPASFLGQWCLVVAEAIGGFYTLVVGGYWGVVFGYKVEVEEVDWGCFGSAASCL